MPRDSKPFLHDLPNAFFVVHDQSVCAPMDSLEGSGLWALLVTEWDLLDGFSDRRQDDLKGGSGSRHGFDVDGSVVFFDDGEGDREPQSASAARAAWW